MGIKRLTNNGEIKSIFSVRNKVIPKGSIAHIIQRAPGKELLFLEDNDYVYFLYLLKEIAKKHKLKILCFAFMPNHVHILINFQEDNASSAIKNICERYAMYFNRKYERKGHVFYGAFRASLCLDESYLLIASLYIHLNPVKANLCDFPASYRWSSSSLYTEEFRGKTFIDYKFILKIISKDIAKAKKIYKRLLKYGSGLDIKSVLESSKAVDIFKTNIHSHILKIFRRKKSYNHITSELILETRIKELREKKRLNKPDQISARKYLIKQLLSRGYNITEIGERLKLSRQHVYRILKS